jgi:metallo-beta-lactamase family protein
MDDINKNVEMIEYGAAEQVQGSCLAIQANSKRYLVDVGSLPSDPKSIDGLLLTHAHLDHISRYLDLISHGFDKGVYAPYQTVDLTELQFIQTITGQFIHNKWVDKHNKTLPIGKKMPHQPVRYVFRDLNKAMQNFRTFNGKKGYPYEVPVKISDDVTATFYDAGHIPGSSQILFEIKLPDGSTRKILTTGDLGRKDYEKYRDDPIASDMPFVNPPYDNFSGLDALVIEATYGNRQHRPLTESITAFEKAVKEAYDNKGRVIIPAFSIARTQIIKCFYYRMNHAGMIPKDMPLVASCPTAEEVEKVMLKHVDEFDARVKEDFKDAFDNPFRNPNLIRHKQMQETWEFIHRKDYSPYIILASSGMGDIGRSRTILRETISDPKTIVLKTSYAAPGTPMWMIRNGNKKIPFDLVGEVENNARFYNMGGLSGHADVDEIVSFIKKIDPDRRLKKIMLKHGEKKSCWDLRETILSRLYYAPDVVVVMKKGQSYFV